MTINATAAILLSLYLAVAEEQGASWERLGGTVQNDILKEYAARGTYIYPPGPSLKLVTDIIAFCADRVPKWNTISISGYHMREAGSTAVQEVAFTLANGLAYVQAALDRGLKIDDFAPPASPSSSTPTTTSWRRWRSSAPPAGCGPSWCRSASRPRIRARSGCASTPRRRARRSPPSSR